MLVQPTDFQGNNWFNHVDHILQEIPWVLGSNITTVTLHSPGQVIFGHHMIILLQTRLEFQTILHH